jgi:hypothetical protein
MTPSILLSIAHSEIPVGASKIQISSFLQRHGFGFSFDESQRRYNAAVPPSQLSRKSGYSLELLIYVDIRGNVVGTDVRESYDGL